MIIRFFTRLFSFCFGNLKLFLVKLFSLRSFSYKLSDAISPFAKITMLRGKITLGSNCRVEQGTIISAVDGAVLFGKGCFVNRNCQIVAHKLIQIGNDVMIGPNTVILDHDHQLENGKVKKRKYITKEIIIEDDVWIGANCVILKGVTIGRGSVIAAGSVVTHDCPAESVLIQKRETKIVSKG